MDLNFMYRSSPSTKCSLVSFSQSNITTMAASHCTFSEDPNTQVAYLDMGLPGMLPMLNEKCLDQAIKCSLALKGEIPPWIKFDRKHYVYPDLPQGYQITQKHHPIMQNGRLDFFNSKDLATHVDIERVQMEQDTAKTIMKDGMCLIDYNRAGMPLLEIVTEAQWISDPEDCKLLVREMQDMLSTLEISEAKAEQGQMRVDVNISVWHSNNNKIRSPRVEIKNVAGAKNVERCVEYELRRHAILLESGKNALPETRRYDATEGKTILLRTKTEDPDYRFF